MEMEEMRQKLKASTVERVKLALGQDSTLAVPEADLLNSAGHIEAHYIDMGLTKGDLLRLERLGMAKRGYTPNFWGPGTTNPRGHVVKPNEYFRGSGHRMRWVIVRDGKVIK